MWKAEHRLVAERGGLRYPSDLTDAEWALIRPLILQARSGQRAPLHAPSQIRAYAA